MAQSMRSLVEQGEVFNPLSSPGHGQGHGYLGANRQVLQEAMAVYGWNDPRFVTESQARKEGWVLREGASPVAVNFRDGEIDKTWTVFNVQEIDGVPSMEEMLAKADLMLAKARDLPGVSGDGASLAEDVPVQHSSSEEKVMDTKQDHGIPAAGGKAAKSASGNELVMSPVSAPTPALAVEPSERKLEAEEIGDEEEGVSIRPANVPPAVDPAIEAQRRRAEGRERREARDGTEGVKAAGEKVADLRAPESLLDGLFVRDEKGDYRRHGEKRVALRDRDDSLVIRDKSPDTYLAAMELAAAKGWTHIELAGRPKMLSEAWVHAQLLGINVVNYEPTEKDRERLEVLKKERENDGARVMPAGGERVAADEPQVEVVGQVAEQKEEKAKAVAQASEKAVDEAPLKPVKMEPIAHTPQAGQMYSGTIVGNTPSHSQLRWHSGIIVNLPKDKLDKNLKLGDQVEVKFDKAGQGKVANRNQKQREERGRA